MKRGIPADKAAKLSTARMFGHAPGGYGNANYYYLVERSGSWESREDLVKAYLSNAQYAYADGVAGELAPEAYEEAMRGTEIVMRNWTDPVRSPLSDKYMWFQGGSLALAVKYVTGKEPEFRISDVRDPDASRTVRAEDALMADFRVKLFNRKWIEGMKKEGYAGADQVATMVDNAFGWEIMREGSVRADVWDEIKKVFVDDKYDLRVREWFEAENPFAFQELTEVMLEAVRKGFWKADDATVKAIAEAYADSVRRHGEGHGHPRRRQREARGVRAEAPRRAGHRSRSGRGAGPGVRAEARARVAARRPAAARPSGATAEPSDAPHRSARARRARLRDAVPPRIHSRTEMTMSVLKDLIFHISDVLLVPCLVLLAVFFAWTLLMLGAFAREALERRRVRGALEGVRRRRDAGASVGRGDRPARAAASSRSCTSAARTSS